MTSLNAAKLGLHDRGLLRPGLYADVTVFDPETVIDQATFLEPFQDNEGIQYVIVNGQLVLDGGKHTVPAPAGHCGMPDEAAPLPLLLPPQQAGVKNRQHDRSSIVLGVNVPTPDPPSTLFSSKSPRALFPVRLREKKPANDKIPHEDLSPPRTKPDRLAGWIQLPAPLSPGRELLSEKGRAGGRARRPARPLAGDRSSDGTATPEGWLLKVGQLCFRNNRRLSSFLVAGYDG